MPSAWSTSSPRTSDIDSLIAPGLVPVDEAGGVLGDAVGQLVRDHVVGRGVARAVDHLVAGPEGVVQRAGAGRAVVGGGAQLAAVAEVRADQRGEVDAERAGVPGGGGAAEVVGLVGVGDAGRGTAAMVALSWYLIVTYLLRQSARSTSAPCLRVTTLSSVPASGRPGRRATSGPWRAKQPAQSDEDGLQANRW